MSTDELGEQLTGWGKVARLQTRGRRTARLIDAAVGYVEEPGGGLLVAAGSAETDWGLNLEADPRCRVTIGDSAWDARAELLDAADAARAVRELILRYGTPAERLGRGPAFRLTRVGSIPEARG